MRNMNEEIAPLSRCQTINVSSFDEEWLPQLIQGSKLSLLFPMEVAFVVSLIYEDEYFEARLRKILAQHSLT